MASALLSLQLLTGAAPPPVITGLTISNTIKTVTFSNLQPATEAYLLQGAAAVTGPFGTQPTTLTFSNLSFRTTNAAPMRFYTVLAQQMSSNALLTVNLLNRLAYGPTPDELERVTTIGPQAYIDEQLAPETISEVLDGYVSETTNSVPPELAPPAQWQYVSYQGTISSARLYLYLTAAGNAYVDDVELHLITTNVTCVDVTNCVTNLVVEAANNVQNGDFEAAPLPITGYPPSWTVSPNHSSSYVTNGLARSGSQSLFIQATSAGSTEASSLWQDTVNSPSGHRCQLSFWYLPGPPAGRILTRLSGSGVTAINNNPPVTPQWIYAKATGFGNTTGGPLYIYLSGAGECFIDDLKLVRGSVAEAGPNLIVNGDFETQPLTNNWSLTADFTNSYISSNFAHSGSGSLRVVATAAGGGGGDSVFQTVNGVTNNGTYTVSFWYLPPSRSRTLTVRLSGSRLVAVPDQTLAGIKRRMDTIGAASYETGAENLQTLNGVNLADLRAWFVMNGIGSKRQLLEILTQFLENHFVTQHAKSVDYFDRFYDDGNLMDIFATDWEYREISKWRAALLNPNCTFYDLLKVHIESPAEIVYLDSVDSRGNGNNVANENYAREIQELFCMGVDNGYDQQDITVMSRAWTGWSVELVEKTNANNPFAAASTRIGFYPGNATGGKSNIIGTWAFNYKAGSHGTNRAPIWSVWNPASPATNPQPTGPKLVPARFGPPWAGQPYALTIPRRPTGDTNSIQDGYDVGRAIADLPFTMEYISVKLCRLFVHDNFPNPTTTVGLPEYDFYDYTNPNRSAEAELIRQCLVAWDTPAGDGRKGNIRNVLRTIFNSDLFRSHGGSLQKVKTPVEFAVSTIRALRSSLPDGSVTANSDGYSIGGRSRTSSSAPLTRMGGMLLFDRDSPDGYPEAGPPWISAGTLAERIRFVQTTLMATNDSRKGDGISGGNNNHTHPVGLLKAKLPSGSWNNADAVASFFLSILYPGEGAGNLQQYRELAVNFLNTDDAGTGSSAFSSLSHTSSGYDTRVRAMVSMLMTLQRFQEQ